MSDLNRAVAHAKKADNDLQEAHILLKAEFPAGATNRAYYALFDGILALLYTNDGPIPKTHTGAHTEFRKQFIRTGIFASAYSNVLTELFNLRQGGDYEIDFVISIDDAQAAIDQVSQFLAEVRTYLLQYNFS